MGPREYVIREENIASVTWLWPEVALALGAILVLLCGVALPRNPRNRTLLVAVTFAFLAVAALALTLLPVGVSKPLFGGLLTHDGLSLFFRWLFLGAGVLAVVLVARSPELPDARIGEYLALLLVLLAALGLMASSSNLLTIYLSIELVSILSYVLTGFRGSDPRGSEAALKYVIYGGVASGVMLFGMSYLFGLFGTLELAELRVRLLALQGSADARMAELTLLLAIVFVLAGLGYKVAAVPWHMWAPDVYEGAPTPFTACLSVAPKAAGFAVMLRLFFSTLGTGEGGAIASLPIPALLGLAAVATMTLGNLAALGQTNLKRLLAWSAIAHSGYLLVGLACGTRQGNTAVLLYLVLYLLMNVGAFAVVEAVARRTGGETLATYRGLAKRAPLAAATFAVFLFSLTGLPPLAGFIGKFYLFHAVVSRAGAASGSDAAAWWGLAIAAVLNTALSLYYYARIVRVMFLEQPTTDEPLRIDAGQAGLVAALCASVVVLGIYWAPLHAWVEQAL